MKNVALALVFTALLSTGFAQDKVGFQAADTVKSVLERQGGQKVELRLSSGEKITGTVQKVGDKTVHLSSIAGQEFFDAVVVLEEVTAVLIRVK